MKIIAFGHRRGVGKDTAAGFLISHLRTNRKGISARKMGFASHLKELAHRAFSWAGLQDEEFYERNYKLKEVILPAVGKSPRDIWIELGNKMREIYPTIWIDLLFKGTKCDYMVIKDLRYPNEVEAIKQNGGYIVRIDNPNVKSYDDIADKALGSFMDWDHVIVNDGDLKKFHDLVIPILSLFGV